jgi:hypothetical protein
MYHPLVESLLKQRVNQQEALMCETEHLSGQRQKAMLEKFLTGGAFKSFGKMYSVCLIICSASPVP